MKARLVAAREIAPGTSHFEFEAVDWDAAFVPGQFLSLTRTIGDETVTRAYSVASPPDGRGFALCANLVPDGRFSPFLFGMQPGDEVDLKGPYGTFTLRRPPSDSIFVATGTGIAPFRSIILAQLAEHPDRSFTLVFGVRQEENLLYRDEWPRIASRFPNFRYLPTLTRPHESWTGLSGRVHGHALDVLGDRRDVDIYVCGLREMVDELRGKLKEIGYDRKRVIYEKYD